MPESIITLANLRFLGRGEHGRQGLVDTESITEVEIHNRYWTKSKDLLSTDNLSQPTVGSLVKFADHVLRLIGTFE